MRVFAALILFLAASASALDWQEAQLDAGGRFAVAGSGQGGWATCALAFPAGVATSADDPYLAQLSARLLGEISVEGRSLRELLGEIGWVLDQRVGQDLSMLLLSGPSEDLFRLPAIIQGMFQYRAEFNEADLARAIHALEIDQQRWRRSAELDLRSQMASLLYGDHPYGKGSGKLAQGTADASKLASFLNERYSPAVVQIVVAGDLEANAEMNRWLPLLKGLSGPRPRFSIWPEPQWGKGRVVSEKNAPMELLLAQMPGLPPSHEKAPLLALSGGLIQLLCESDIRDARLAMVVSAWYRFNAVGPSHLEIAIRGLAPGARDRVEAVLRRIIDRVRLGEYSEFAVISAKDRIVERMVEHSSQGQGPDSSKLSSLLAWTEETARQEMLLRDLRADFSRRTMESRPAHIAEFATEWLKDETILIGILPAD
ncbi:insulinase family protein [bacterium]|nr:insulinase family protein [bacterium]